MTRFGGIGMTRPEHFPKRFNVYAQGSTTSDRGRDRLGSPELKATIRCILAAAKPEEQLQFHQMGVKVTHTLVQRGAPAAKENDILALAKNGVETRRFRVQAVHNKGEMGIDTVYYCEERGDLK